MLCSRDYIEHRTFEDQLACLSDQNMFASDIKDWSKDIGRCISHCLYMSPTVFMYPVKTLHLIPRVHNSLGRVSNFTIPYEK